MIVRNLNKRVEMNILVFLIKNTGKYFVSARDIRKKGNIEKIPLKFIMEEEFYHRNPLIGGFHIPNWVVSGDSNTVGILSIQTYKGLPRFITRDLNRFIDKTAQEWDVEAYHPILFENYETKNNSR